MGNKSTLVATLPQPNAEETGKTRDKLAEKADKGDKIGWSRENVKNYVNVLEKIGTTNLDLAKSVQSGRVPLNGTIVPLDFTEGWFREITQLNSVCARASCWSPFILTAQNLK